MAKGKRRNPSKEAAVMWASQWLDSDDWLLLSIAMTGGNKSENEVTQLVLLSPSGDTVMNTLVRPRQGMRYMWAYYRFGHTMEDLEDAATFDLVFPEFQALTRGKTLLTYNAEECAQALRLSAELTGITSGHFELDGLSEAHAMYVGSKYDEDDLPWDRGDPIDALERGKIHLELVRKLGGQHIPVIPLTSTRRAESQIPALLGFAIILIAAFCVFALGKFIVTGGH